MTLDGAVPLHLLGRRSQVSALGNDGPFGSNRSNGAEVALYDAMMGLGSGTGRGPLGEAVGAANRLALSRARDVTPAFADASVGQAASLTAQLHRAALLINANVGTRVLGATLESFDTHRDQRWMHNHLLTDFDAAIERFYAVLDPKWADQVVLMTFSEFGRRAQDNGSGTDHGTSAPHVVIGDRVRGGLHGTQPSLTDLDSRGDLRVTVDLRSMYASVLGGWMGVDPAPILGGSYPQIPLFSSTPQPYRPKAMAADKRFAPFHDAGRFIDQQYLDFRDRHPTAAQRDLWVRRVLGSSWSINSTMERFYEGSRFYTPGIPIQRLAINLTGAPASFDDFERWCALHRMYGLRAVVAELIGNERFRARYTRLWGMSMVIDRLNRDLTGRAADRVARSPRGSPAIDKQRRAGLDRLHRRPVGEGGGQGAAASAGDGRHDRGRHAPTVALAGDDRGVGHEAVCRDVRSRRCCASHLRSATYAARFA